MCRLQSLIDALDTHNVAEHLRQLTDAYRVHLFDVVMQFRALFSDADGAAAGAAAPGANASAPAREVFGWAHHRVQFYVDRMHQLLPLCAPLPATHGAPRARVHRRACRASCAKTAHSCASDEPPAKG